ncbi:MAG: T9SS type A sorting domain-containing protein [Calditrichaceae bacterium]|nr:T9SS type A sorting domain-containing protein [Calditrichaceae bacterium]
MHNWICLILFLLIQNMFPKENLLSFENLPDKIFINTETTLTCKFKNSQVASIKKWTWRIELRNHIDTFTLIQEDSISGTEQSQWLFTVDSIPDYANYGDFYHYNGNYHCQYSGYLIVFAEDLNGNYYSLVIDIIIIGKSVDHLPSWYCCNGDFVAITDGEKIIHKNESLSYTCHFFDDDETGDHADYWNWRFFTFNENGKYIINTTDSLYGLNSSIWEFKFDSLDNHFNYIRDSLNDIYAFITVNTHNDNLHLDNDMNEIKILATPLTVDNTQIIHSADFTLYPNYPNPFNPRTIISWQLPVSCKVELSIYNILGQDVAKPVNEEQSAGLHKVEFNASALPSGIYIYSLKTGSVEQSKKMLLLR